MGDRERRYEAYTVLNGAFLRAEHEVGKEALNLAPTTLALGSVDLVGPKTVRDTAIAAYKALVIWQASEGHDPEAKADWYTAVTAYQSACREVLRVADYV